jgi:predicted dienelactone hydrolase
MKKYFVFIFLSVFLIANEPKLGVKTFRSYDKQRNRPIIIEVWYPADNDAYDFKVSNSAWEPFSEARDASIFNVEKKYPIIFMSHGNGGDRRSISWVVKNLVQNNYIVASVEHFGDTFKNFLPDQYLRAWNRPLDISFAIDFLTKKSLFKNNIDPENIGFVGYSLGGMTGIWLAGGIASDFEKLLKRYQFFTREFPDDVIESLEYEKTRTSYFDSRIKAYFLMAPSTWGFNYESLSNINMPLFVVGAECDDLLPASTHARFLSSCVKNSEYELIGGGAGHYIFLNCISDLGRIVIDERYYQDPPTVSRKKVHLKVSQMINAFFKKHFVD